MHRPVNTPRNSPCPEDNQTRKKGPALAFCPIFKGTPPWCPSCSDFRPPRNTTQGPFSVGLVVKPAAALGRFHILGRSHQSSPPDRCPWRGGKRFSESVQKTSPSRSVDPAPGLSLRIGGQHRPPFIQRVHRQVAFVTLQRPLRSGRISLIVKLKVAVCGLQWLTPLWVKCAPQSYGARPDESIRRFDLRAGQAPANAAAADMSANETSGRPPGPISCRAATRHTGDQQASPPIQRCWTRRQGRPLVLWRPITTRIGRRPCAPRDRPIIRTKQHQRHRQICVAHAISSSPNGTDHCHGPHECPSTVSTRRWNWS